MAGIHSQGRILRIFERDGMIRLHPLALFHMGIQQLCHIHALNRLRRKQIQAFLHQMICGRHHFQKIADVQGTCVNLMDHVIFHKVNAPAIVDPHPVLPGIPFHGNNGTQPVSVVCHGNRLYGIILFQLVDSVTVAANIQIALGIFTQGQDDPIFHRTGITVIDTVYCIIAHNDKTVSGSYRNIPVFAYQQRTDLIGRHAFRYAPLLPLPVFIAQ